MEINIRSRIWNKIQHSLIEGAPLPVWALRIKMILFPIKYLFYRESRESGYQWDADEWIIHGIRYSDRAFQVFSQSRGELFRMRCQNGALNVTRVMETRRMEEEKI